MIPLEEYQKVLGDKYSSEEIEKLRYNLYALAELMVHSYLKERERLKKSKVGE